MKLGPLMYLAIALALSVLLNVFLGWKWAGSKQSCRADMERAAGMAIENERERALKAGEQSGEIVQDTRADTRHDVSGGQGDTNAREQAIRTVVVHGDCRMPVGLPSLQPAIDAANAAAGD